MWMETWLSLGGRLKLGTHSPRLLARSTLTDLSILLPTVLPWLRRKSRQNKTMKAKGMSKVESSQKSTSRIRKLLGAISKACSTVQTLMAVKTPRSGWLTRKIAYMSTWWARRQSKNVKNSNVVSTRIVTKAGLVASRNVLFFDFQFSNLLSK